MADAAGHSVPHSLVMFLRPFRDAFTAPTWEHVLVLVMGAILVPGRRTVASALRIMGLGQARHFTSYHRVLNRNAWSAHELSRRLLVRLVDAFVPDGEPVVMGLDDSIERRWGSRIKKRGIYRDPVRSSKGHFTQGVLHPAVWTRGRGYAASLRSDWFQAARAAAGLRYPFLAMSQS